MFSAIRVTAFGGPEVLNLYKNVAMLKPGMDQVVVAVRAAGVNPVDTYIRSGTHTRKPTLPYTPGSEGAGIIQEIGVNVTGFKVGDRVWFHKCITGSYAEYALCHSSHVHFLSLRANFEQGAAVGVAYLTAYRALFHKGKAQSGETVLIHGASGGVGIAAVQLAMVEGIQVFGTAGSIDGIELLRGLGVENVFNHSTQNYQDEILKATGGNGVNIILEMLANVNLGKDLKLLSKNGRVMIVGSRGNVEVNPRDAMTREISIHGVMLMHATEEETSSASSVIEKELKKGTLKPVVGQRYALKDAAVAHKDIIEGTGARGKIVLVVSPSAPHEV